MNEPFFKPLGEMVPKLGRVSRPARPEAAPVEDSPPPPPVVEEKLKAKAAKLSNPKWEAEDVGFNEETPISVELELPPEIAHKTRVSFDLFARTPKGPEKIAHGEANAEDGKAVAKIPVYIPSYQNENGDRLRKVEYYFNAQHSEAEPLDGSKSPKLVEEMANRILEIHILQNVTFATGKSFIRASKAADLKALGQAVKDWKAKHADGKLAVFGHADAVGEELSNKSLSERRAKSVHAYLAKDPKPWEELFGEEKWGLASVQELLKHLGHDPGVIDGQDGPKTQAAVKEFQGKQGLGQTGSADAKTREALFQAYFGQAESPASAAKDFDVIDGKAFTGCSEFNLIDNSQGPSETNRRVAVLMLKASKNFPINYPCKQGAILPCQKQAGLKGERRSPGFRCKFYDGLVEEKGGGGTVTGEAPKAFFKTLSPWFIPGPADEGGETADIEIELAGPADRADRFDWEVYGSGYCEADRKDDGTFAFKALDKPIALQAREFAGDAAKPGLVKIPDWDGAVSAKEGALKAEEGKPSFINVAFSPYTALGRYYKSPDDKRSALVLGGFWPAFKGGILQPEGLTVTWKVTGTSKLKLGKLELVDKSGAALFEKELAAADSSEGDHEFAWDGKTKDGAEITADHLPVRPRISLWSADPEPEALALCAMQTEVRIFVHPETGDEKEGGPYPQSLAFSLPPQTVKVPEEKDQEAWAQYKLAEAGFHPGPIGIPFGDPAKIALREFQRSYPKEAVQPFSRLKPTGNLDADTLSALKRLKPDTRPWFGDVATRADLTREKAQETLGAPEKELLVWVDDRHTNTSAGAGDFFMDDYHGGMAIGDSRPAKDQASVPRPWIPLSASLSILSKSSTLADKEPKRTAAAARALGFLRVDFHSVDPEPDHSTVDTGHAQFKTNLHRSRKWMRETYSDWSVTHKGRKLYNAPQKQGGLRPDDASAYYKATFGIDADSFPPLLAVADDAAEKVSVRSLHREVTDKVPRDIVGRFNVYFRPSIIAGDGYQVEASLGLDKEPGRLGDFPNRAGLALRYPAAPKGRTARFRLWRKASYRAYACWAPAGEKHWPAQAPLAAELYRGANLHLVHESGADKEFKVTDLVTAKEYSDNIKATVTDPAYTSLTITLDPEKVWPFTSEKRLGIPISKLGGTLRTFYDDVFDPMFNATWRRFRENLLHLLMKQVEKLHGLHRGYFLTEFRSSQSLTGVEYACGTCHTTIVEIVNNLTAAETLQGKPCRKLGCKGKWAKSKSSTWVDGIPMPAVGVSMGGTWLFTSGDHSVWAHEIGHIRHLEHSPSQPGSPNIAPGGKAAQHDSQKNPDPALSAEPAKDQGWDRACIMSYNFKDPMYFCGKCLLKNRGLAVEGLANPDGAEHD